MRVLKNVFDNKQMRCFFLYSCSGALIFESSIFTTFLIQKGLQLSSIAFLISCYSIGVIFFEYITGVLADRYSRKNILILSTVFLVMGELVFIFCHDFMSGLAGFSLMAVSVASKSGADVALIYDYMMKNGIEHKFGHLTSIVGSISLTLGAFSTVIGPYLFKLNMNIPIITSIVFSLLSLMFLSMIEDSTQFERDRAMRSVIKSSFKEMFKSRSVISILLYSVIIYPCFHVIIWMLQPYLTSNKISIEHFGYIYLGFSLCQAGGTKMADFINTHFGWRKSLFLSGVGIAGPFLILSLSYREAVFVALPLAGFSFGVFYTVNAIALNKHILSETRASVLSMQHAITKAVQIIVFAGIGGALKFVAIKGIFLHYGVFILVLLPILMVLSHHKEVASNDMKP